MKCYHCGGQTFNHRTGCPDIVVNAKPKIESNADWAKRTSKESEDVADNYWDPNMFSSSLPRPPLKRVYTSFLPLEVSAVAASNTVWIQSQPQVSCRIQRLWIDEAISDCFMINSVRMMANETLIVGGNGRVFGNLFRSGRWPLQDKTDSIFGIDLSGWPTMSPANRVQILVENISVQCCPFRGCFEVLCAA